LRVYVDGMGSFFYFLFLASNTRTVKTTECTGKKLGTQIGVANLTCSVILISLLFHSVP